MRSCVGSFLLIFLLVDSAWAANLRIVGCDVVWSPTAGPCYVLIVNEQGVTDCLASWQLDLAITPTEGATGVLQFAFVDLPRQPSEGYLLAGDSWVLDGPAPPPEPPFVGPIDTVLITDFALSGFGSEVPASDRALLRADFSALADVQGVFAITAIPGPDHSSWAAWDGNEMTVRAFDNIPFEGDPAIIGYVTVLIAEPHGLLLLLAGAVVVLAFGHRVRRSPSKQREGTV